MSYELQLFSKAKSEGNPQLLNEQSFFELDNKIKARAFDCQSDHALKLYVQNYQTQLHGYRKNDICSSWADRLLYSLENSFIKHVDTSLPMSHMAREEEIGCFREQLKELRRVAPTALSPEMAKAVKPLLNICVHSITHHEVRYAKQLALEWNSGKNYSLADEESMVAFLKEVNYNSGRFFNFLVNKSISKYAHLDCPRSQAEILSALRIEYLPKGEENLGFATENEGIAKQMEEWINSEIQRCHKQMKLHKLEPPVESDPKTKLDLAWTVDEIAVFMKKMRDNGFILNEREKDIHQVISETFTTPRTRNISPVSAETKYYQKDVTVNDSLIAKLLQLVKSLR